MWHLWHTCLWSHSPKSICTFSYFLFYFPGICKYLFSSKQQIRHNRHLMIYCAGHFVWYYGEQMDEWERPSIPCWWYTLLVIMSVLKYSPSSGSIKRLLVLFMKSLLFVHSTDVILQSNPWHFFILHKQRSKKVSLQSVNLLSDYLEAYVP